MDSDTRTKMIDLRDWAKEQLEKTEKSIGVFERGEMRIGARVTGQPLTDGSADHLSTLKRIAEDMRELIADLERDIGK